MTMRLLALLLLLPWLAGAAEIHFYIGSYTGASGSKGIYQGELDTETGKLGPVTLAAAIANPSFLALSPNGKTLYAALEEWNAAGVAAFARGSDGVLTPLKTTAMAGAGTVHVSLDAAGHHLLAANYNSGSIACFQVGEGGAVGDQTAAISLSGSGPDKDRQTSPHAHSIYASPDGRAVYACDLGTDHIWIFKLSGKGELTPNDPRSASVPPGSGPRHLSFSANGRFVYVANEMGHSVTAFYRNTSSNALTPLQTLSALPAEVSTEAGSVPSAKVTTAEIVVHPSGMWLYVSNRGCDTISVFSVGADGRLALVQSVSALVKGPRSFAVDPSGKWLIAAGQNDNRIAELKINPASGMLTQTSQSAQVGSPVCVLFEGK